MITNQYAYNGDGQRVQVIDSQGTKKQIWDGENVLLETDGLNVTQVVYTNEPAGYGNLLSQRRGSTTNFYLYDALGSTRKLVNSSGTATDSYDYRAYGETYASSGTTVNVFRWVGRQGYYFDVDRSAYYVRARHYSPKQGRWISQDPIGFRGSKWNLYQYVNGVPVALFDPKGLAVDNRDHPERTDLEWIDCMKDNLGAFADCMVNTGLITATCLTFCLRGVCKWWPPWCTSCFLGCAVVFTGSTIICLVGYASGREKCDEEWRQREKKKEEKRKNPGNAPIACVPSPVING